jgi:hypothetical protein
MGVISANTIEVSPAQLLGVNLTSPIGKFPISQFAEVRVELIPISFVNKNPNHPNARVLIAGKTGTPNILIANSELNAGKVLGKHLADLLKLPYQEQLHPH